jgi:hypothetical protein
MVDAQPGVPAVGVPEIIPESIDAFVRMNLSERIGPTLRDEIAIGGSNLRTEERVIEPTLRLVDVHIRGHDVEIASQDDLITSREKVGSVLGQPFEPTKLVVELRSRRRIAVRQVQASD